MAYSIKKKFSFSGKRDHIISKPTDTSQVDGPATVETSRNRTNTQYVMMMPPDKEVEERVLQNRFQYLSSNLPPDDIAIEMNTRSLLTVKEHEEYLSMKRAHTSDSTKSEYLLQCLGRRRAGFLTRFCEILREIDQASYLADDITEAYKTLALHKGSRLSSLKRSSTLSLSDPDLRSKDVDEYHCAECSRCKVLERHNRKLERQVRYLKEQQDFYNSTLLPFKPLAEVAQEQLQRALTEMNKLIKQVPLMQEAITQTSGGIAATQASLRKMNDVLVQGAKQKTVATGTPLSTSLRSSTVSNTAATSEGELLRRHTNL